MGGWRRKTWRRIGAALGGAALYIQLVFAGLGMLGLASPGGPAGAFGDHAFCLAGQDGTGQDGAGRTDTGQPDGSGGPAPPLHDHAAFCCLWHPLPAVEPFAAIAAAPVAYADIVVGHASDAPAIAGTSHDPPNARGPPLPA